MSKASFHQSVPEKKIRVFMEDSRKKGLHITPQRVAIFKKLIGTDSHPSAEEVYEGLREELPTLSLGTVYKTLETFEKHGFISKTRSTGEKARFDANQALHHHLICKTCGRIEDFYDARLNDMAMPANVRSGFRIEDYRIDFRGICKFCRGE